MDDMKHIKAEVLAAAMPYIPAYQKAERELDSFNAQMDTKYFETTKKKELAESIAAGGPHAPGIELIRNAKSGSLNLMDSMTKEEINLKMELIHATENTAKKVRDAMVPVMAKHGLMTPGPVDHEEPMGPAPSIGYDMITQILHDLATQATKPHVSQTQHVPHAVAKPAQWKTGGR